MSFTKKFYVADTHFGHNEVIIHCCRPFTDAHEMDEAMVSRWNAVVGKSDIVYHLGDFAAGCDADHAREIFNRLNGRKYLIIGNHDLDSKGRLSKRVRDLAWAAPPTHALETTDAGQRLYLHHYACRVWPSSHYQSWHFFGHSHGRVPPHGRSRDVGVDLPDVSFTPRTFAQLTANMPVES